MHKNPFLSRTNLLGILQLAAGLLALATRSEFVSQYPTAVAALVSISGVVTIALRFATKLPVSFSPQPDQPRVQGIMRRPAVVVRATSPEIDRQAKAIADRVPVSVGMDPISILSLITTVLPMLIGCFRQNDELDAASTAAAVREYNERHPKNLRRRIANRIRRESSLPITMPKALILADAVVEQAISVDTESAVAICGECVSCE